MDAHDRYLLTLSMLEGNRDARKILADLLEEQGDRGLAQWAREGRNLPQQRLEFSLMLLPISAVMSLGADFLQAVLPSANDPAPQEATTCIAFVRAWLGGERTDREARDFAFACRQIVTVSSSPEWRSMHHWRRYRPLPEVSNLLYEALAHAAQGIVDEGSPTYKNHHRENEARLCIRRIVAATCRFINEDAHQSLLPWQIEQTKSVLQQLTST